VNCSGQWTDFQRWFVGEQCGPKVDAIRFAGTPGARMSEGLAEALARPDLVAVVFCPSNPFLSVDPILAVDGVREALLALQVPRIAVSPLIGGKALKGPLSKLLAEMGLSGNNRDVANHYGPILTHFVIDRSDAADAEELTGLALTVTDTLMRSAEDQTRLAGEVLAAVSI
jgi:LPPG:FO 2-phospho-L-lactate transferase